MLLTHILFLEIAGSAGDDFKAQVRSGHLSHNPFANFLSQGIPLPPHAYSAPADVIASAVSYLCKPESYFITGESIIRVQERGFLY